MSKDAGMHPPSQAKSKPIVKKEQTVDAMLVRRERPTAPNKPKVAT